MANTLHVAHGNEMSLTLLRGTQYYQGHTYLEPAETFRTSSFWKHTREFFNTKF